MLFHEGFAYRLHSRDRNGRERFWRCKYYRSKLSKHGACKTSLCISVSGSINVYGEHNHPKEDPSLLFPASAP
ncbi:hypothetical protein RUM44_009510 [Polyplax serrata]|uniref:FLYWCH-type domain-containing protein n=1 Tax=Polyplax serrata TaxID=468196 RepID=A0ABR1AT59_POLSC